MKKTIIGIILMFTITLMISLTGCSNTNTWTCNTTIENNNGLMTNTTMCVNGNHTTMNIIMTQENAGMFEELTKSVMKSLCVVEGNVTPEGEVIDKFSLIYNGEQLCE